MASLKRDGLIPPLTRRVSSRDHIAPDSTSSQAFLPVFWDELQRARGEEKAMDDLFISILFSKLSVLVLLSKKPSGVEWI